MNFYRKTKEKSVSPLFFCFFPTCFLKKILKIYPHTVIYIHPKKSYKNTHLTWIGADLQLSSNACLLSDPSTPHSAPDGPPRIRFPAKSRRWRNFRRPPSLDSTATSPVSGPRATSPKIIAAATSFSQRRRPRLATPHFDNATGFVDGWWWRRQWWNYPT